MVSVLLTNKYGHAVFGIILLRFNRCIIQSIVYYSVYKTESAAKEYSNEVSIYYTILTEVRYTVHPYY
jgi:hypothetical protein